MLATNGEVSGMIFPNKGGQYTLRVLMYADQAAKSLPRCRSSWAIKRSVAPTSKVRKINRKRLRSRPRSHLVGNVRDLVPERFLGRSIQEGSQPAYCFDRLGSADRNQLSGSS